MNKNEEMLKDFVRYCRLNKDERFFQALRNWLGVPYILISNRSPRLKGFGRKNCEDTFYLEIKPKGDE